MELLSQELRDATMVSIGHRAKLADFHHRKIILLRRHGGARIVSDVHPVRDAGRTGISLATSRAHALAHTIHPSLDRWRA